MDKKELQAIAQAAAKNIKTEADLNEFRAMLTKITVEAALNAELDDHLGFDKHEQSDSNNNRNGEPTRPCRLRTASLSWPHLATVPAVSSRSW